MVFIPSFFVCFEGVWAQFRREYMPLDFFILFKIAYCTEKMCFNSLQARFMEAAVAYKKKIGFNGIST